MSNVIIRVLFSFVMSSFFHIDLLASAYNNPFDADDILLVIDMQSNYVKHSPEVQDRVCELVRFARETNIPVICFEFFQEFLGPTVPEITSILTGYPHFCSLNKDSMSCMEPLLDHFHKSGSHYLGKKIWICGFLTSECIAASVEDLCKIADLKSVVIVSDCCGDKKDKHEEACYNFEKLARSSDRFFVKTLSSFMF